MKIDARKKDISFNFFMKCFVSYKRTRSIMVL